MRRTLILRSCGLAFSLSGALIIVSVALYGYNADLVPYAPAFMAFPCVLLVPFIWTEKSSSWLLYLCILAATYSLWGTIATIHRLSYYRSSFDFLLERTYVELLLCLPPFVRKFCLVLK